MLTPTPIHQQDEISIQSVSGLLVIGCLFSVIGGYMDAFSYLAHGHVFANAQTGNVLFFSLYASGGEWAQAMRHLPPIAAFMLGVIVARLIGTHLQKHSFRATLWCQGIELLILAGLAVSAASLPNDWIVPIISLVAALQNTSLSAVGPWTFNNAMTTGNIRTATSGLVLWSLGREREKNRGNVIVSGSVFLSFLIGGLGGGLYTRYDVKHALLPCVLLVLVAFLLTLRQRKLHETSPHKGFTSSL